MPPASRNPRTIAVGAVVAALLVVAIVAAAGLGNPLNDFTPYRGRGAITVICGVLGLTGAAALLLRPSPARPDHLAWFSAIVSTLCVLATVFVWICVGTGHSLKDVPGSPVSDRRQMAAYLATHEKELGRPQQIPTGVMIETLQFTEANNVKLTGYVWQHLPASDPADKPQIELPDAVDGGITDEFFRDRDGDRQVIGWKLRVTLREHFDYGHYPLDKQAVWLVMWPRATNTVLVPDFSAYPPWHPDEKLGMYPGLVTGEWEPQFTTYSLDHAQERTNYGRPGTRIDGQIPELTFSAGLGREFLSPLLDRLVPLGVIAMLVFGSLFVVTTDSDRRTLSGFSTWAVIGFCGSMMLVVSVQHSSLRSATGSTGVVYAEYFYFILYVVIGLVALNVVEHTSAKRFPLVDWRGNAAARLLYWPVITVLLLATTVGVFLL